MLVVEKVEFPLITTSFAAVLISADGYNVYQK